MHVGHGLVQHAGPGWKYDWPLRNQNILNLEVLRCMIQWSGWLVGAGCSKVRGWQAKKVMNKPRLLMILMEEVQAVFSKFTGRK